MEVENPKLKNIESGAEISVTQSPFLIGRGLNCHYVIPSEFISRNHCELEKQGNKWLLKDKSRNGTFVNKSCAKAAGIYLNNEDEITLSPEGHTYTFLFAPPASPPPYIVALTHNLPSQATTSAPGHFPEDYADLLNSDLELEAVLSTMDSPSQVASSSSNNRTQIKISSSNSLQDSQTNVIPGPSTRKSPAIGDSPSRKRSKLADDSPTQDLGSDKNGNPMIDCETQQKTSESVSDTKESTESALKNKEISTQQDQLEEMEDEMQCSVCSEMFVKATTLNCSHTFCKYCIETWKKTRDICPICRTKITSLNATLVLDNLIERVIKSSSKELKERRKALLEERKKLEEPKVPTINHTNYNRGRGRNRTRGRGRGRGNINSNRGRNYDIPDPTFQVPPPPLVIELESTSDSDLSTSTTESDSEDGWREEYDNDEWEPGVPGAYYGGYGHCYSCGRRGHWANGCPFS